MAEHWASLDTIKAEDGEEAIANWGKVVSDKNGNFIDSSCALAVTDAGFEKATGWKPLNLIYNAQYSLNIQFVPYADCVHSAKMAMRYFSPLN